MLGALDNLHQPREHIAFHDAELAVAALQESNNQSQYQETALILLTRWASQEAAVEGMLTYWAMHGIDRLPSAHMQPRMCKSRWFYWTWERNV